MPALTSTEIDRIAALAHLELTAGERELFTRQLEEILAYAARVRDVDTSRIPPTTHVLTPDTVLRDDETRASLTRDAALALAPDADVRGGLYRVPPVFGE